MNPQRASILGAALIVVIAGCTSAPPAASERLSTITPLPALAEAQTSSAATTQPSTPATATSASIMNDARGWAFRVRSVDCLATGSSFATATGIVTNRHVASGSENVQMSTWDGTDFNAAVSGVSSGPDLALLSNTDMPDVPQPATLAFTDAPAGTAVWAAGYPEGNQLTVTPGHIRVF